MTAPVLELLDVRVFASDRAILDVSHFAIEREESLALVGPNGAGKTTLLHVAALLRVPDRGAVSILGQEATSRDAATLRRHLAVVFQQPLLFDVGVLANAAAGARFQGLPRREAERRARDWLERFGIAQLANQKARTLSGGEAARVALARAFATAPALLLLDEPFSALDAPTRAQLLPVLRARLRDSGVSSILVTHDLEEAFAFADRIAFMDHGQILATGDPRFLIARPPSRRVAELLGIENILPVTIASVEGGTAWLRLLSGGPLLRVRIAHEDRLQPGQEATLALPAGAVRVSEARQGHIETGNALPGAISAVTATRGGPRLVVETPVPFVAVAPWSAGARTWAIGDRVTLTFNVDTGCLIADS